MPLTTKVERIDYRRVTIRVGGSLDSATAPELEKVLGPVLLEEGTRLVTFDLADLEFLSSAGIRVLLAARKRMRAREGIFAMENMQPQIARVFEAVKALPGFAV